MSKILSNTWVLLIILIIVETISMSFLAYDKKKYRGIYIIGIFGYALVAFIFYKILQNKSITGANAVWNIGSIIIVTIVGIVFFKTKLDKYQYLGLLLAIISVLLIEHDSFKQILI